MRSHFFCKPGTCNNQNVTNHRLFGDSGLIKMKKKTKKKQIPLLHMLTYGIMYTTHTLIELLGLPYSSISKRDSPTLSHKCNILGGCDKKELKS